MCWESQPKWIYMYEYFTYQFLLFPKFDFPDQIVLIMGY